jgi:hypothetical protein
MKLRAKRSKLAIQDPIRFEPVSKENTMLVISLSPLSFLKNDKLSYSFIEREFYKSGMPKD